MMTRPLRVVAAALLATSTALLATSSSPVDAGKSTLVARFTQMNVDVEGRFTRFKGSVSYDPTQPAAASAELSIDTASFDIGDEEYNAEVRKKEWFDVQQHPAASFKSTAVRSLGADRFEATGTLLLKGRTQTVTAPVTVKASGTGRRFDGELPVSRKAFGLGDPGWDDVLEDKVMVKFSILVPAS